MKRMIMLGLLLKATTSVYATTGSAVGIDYRDAFSAVKLQNAVFENVTDRPVRFNVFTDIVEPLASGESCVLSATDGRSFIVKHPKTGETVLADKLSVSNRKKDFAYTTVRAQKLITLNPGERYREETPWPSYVAGVSVDEAVQWSAYEDLLTIFIGSESSVDFEDTKFIAEPKDFKKQLKLYNEYFMFDPYASEEVILNDFKSQALGVMGEKREAQIVVTLTSYPARFDTTWLAIESLLRQEVKPDRVVLNLYEGEFPGRVLPWFIRQQMKRGLEINWCPENLKVFLKYIPTIQNYPDSCIVAFDDDIIYDSRRLKLLVEGHAEHPEDVICYDARIVSFANGKMLPVNQWKFTGLSPSLFMEEIYPSQQLVAEGVGGVLFPPYSLHVGEYANRAVFEKLSASDDDIWHYIMAILNSKRIYKCKREHARMNRAIDDTQEIGLYNVNFSNNFLRLTAQTLALFDHYHIPEKLGFPPIYTVFPSLTEEETLLKESIERIGVFDPVYYIEQTSNDTLGMHPIDHFVKVGRHRGFNINKSMNHNFVVKMGGYSKLDLHSTRQIRFVFEGCKGNPYSQLMYSFLSSKFEIVDVLNSSIDKALSLQSQGGAPVVYCQHFPHFDAYNDRRSVRDAQIKYFKKIKEFKARGGIFTWVWNDFTRVEAPYLDLEIQKHQLLHDEADLIHLFNEEVLSVLESTYTLDRAKIICQRLGNYGGYYDDSVDSNAARLKLGLDKRKTVFMSLGAIRRYKNVHSILSSFKIFSEGKNDVSLVIAGSHPGSEYHTYFTPFMSLARETKNVEAKAGFIEDEDIQYYCKAADFMVFANEDKMLSSSSVILSLTFGTPVIVPRIPAFSFLEGQPFAIMYSPADSNGLSDAFTYAVGLDVSTRFDISRKAKEYADSLSWQATAQVFESEVLKLVNIKYPLYQSLELGLKSGLKIPFTNTDSTIRLNYGFSSQEVDGIWSDGASSSLTLFVDDIEKRKTVNVFGHAFVPKADISMKINIFSEGVHVYKDLEVLYTNTSRVLTFDVMPMQAALHLQFVYDKADSPYNNGMGNDKRKLAFKFREIQVIDN